MFMFFLASFPCMQALGSGHHLYQGSWIEALNQAGYSVGGIDLQGAGRSEGLRWFVNNFDHYVDDIVHHAK